MYMQIIYKTLSTHLINRLTLSPLKPVFSAECHSIQHIKTGFSGERVKDSFLYNTLKCMYKYLNVCYCYYIVDFLNTNRENSLWAFG